MTSPSQKNLPTSPSFQSISSPTHLKRKTSIISNLKSKVEKQPNLKKLSIFMKTNDTTANSQPQSALLNLNKDNSKSKSISSKRASVFLKSNLKPQISNSNLLKFHLEKEKEIKNLMPDDPEIIFLDIMRFIKKKLYRKAYYIIEKYLSYRRNFRLSLEIKYNRMFTIVINKICKIKLIKFQNNHTNFAHKLIIKGLSAIKNFCNYLTIFLFKKFPKKPKKIVTDEKECEPYLSYDEEIYKIPQKFDKRAQLHKNSSHILASSRSNSLRKLTTNNSLENIIDRLENKALFHDEFREDDEFFDEVMIKEKQKLKKISVPGESFFFVKNLFEMLINFSVIYRNLGLYNLSYKYLFCLEENSKSFENTFDPNLLQTLGKGKFLLGMFYMQFYKYEEAIKTLDEAMLIIHRELLIRMTSMFYMKEVKRKYRMNYFNCIRTLIMILYSLCLTFAHIKNYRKMFESLCLAYMFADKFLQRIDVVKKFIKKIYVDLGENVGSYLHEISEMEKIILDILPKNTVFHQKFLISQNKCENCDPFEEINKRLYKKYQWDIFNKQQFIYIAVPNNENKKDNLVKSDSKRRFSRVYHKKSISEDYVNMQKTEKTEKTEKKDTQRDSNNLYTEILSRRSFLKDEGDKLNSESSSQESMIFNENPINYFYRWSKNKIIEKNSKFLTRKNYEEFSTEYKPKVLTTNKYFKDFIDLKKEKIENDGKNGKESLSKRFKTEESQKNENYKDLDYFMNQVVDQNFSKKYSSKSYDDKLKDFKSFMKDEDFDKKEFNFSKKMLFMKRKENCGIKIKKKENVKTNNQITLYNNVEKNANVMESKISIQKQTNIFKENIKKKYANIILEQQENDDDDSQTSKNGDFRACRLVKLLIKHKEVLNLNKVAKIYQEKIKEREKQEKKNLEESLKKQSKMNKKKDFYNFKSIHTLKHLLDKKAPQSSYLKAKSHRLPMKSWASPRKSNLNSFLKTIGSSNFGSSKTRKSAASEVNIENFDQKKIENYEKAQNIIKVLSDEMERTNAITDNEITKKKAKEIETDSSEIQFNNQALSDLAKSAFYVSLDRQNKNKIMSFADLVKIKAKQHFKGSKNFFANSVFGTSFK